MSRVNKREEVKEVVGDYSWPAYTMKQRSDGKYVVYCVMIDPETSLADPAVTEVIVADIKDEAREKLMVKMGEVLSS